MVISTPDQTTEVMVEGWTLEAAEKQLLFTVSYGTSYGQELFTETKMNGETKLEKSKESEQRNALFFRE